MLPTVGRIVHYQSYGSPGGEFASVPRAAIVTEVDPPPAATDTPDIGICVVNPTGFFFNRHVPYSEEGKPGTWRWPPRT